jgi:hypothetical protein
MSPFAPVNQHYLGLLLLLGFTVTAFFAVVSDALPSGPGRHPRVTIRERGVRLACRVVGPPIRGSASTAPGRR